MQSVELGERFHYVKDWEERLENESLQGKTVVGISYDDNEGELALLCSDGTVCVFYHSQNCCEYVRIEDITGDLSDLIGSPILLYAETSFRGEEGESSTWTFYKFATIKGYVDIRWLGTSNGYYSESVDCCWTTNNMI